MILGPPLFAQDTWELLPDVPFEQGVSCGGGLTTDGTYLYAADFSGDGDYDFIDLDGNGAYTSGEHLSELGIPNGSVRVARFDPSGNTWASLPAINASGVGGDAFSAGDFNGGLFHAGGMLYYYQFRAGPNRCALYRYTLADGLSGAWTEVWDLDTATAMIDGSAGMAVAEGTGAPVILHHEGGGAYHFARSTGIDGGTAPTHLRLTPEWPFSGAHFPRNGAWAYDGLNGTLYHMSGNQLVQWDPSAVYAPDDFTSAVPNGSDNLAVFSTTIASLKSTLGWDPGGTADNPGASLWGNCMVVVNDPSGVTAGPAGEDTGANVLYLVRGETSESGFPFNEGRGRADNGDFARYFPATGNTQNLPPAPFTVGKGAAACYLDGCIYLLQGETATSSPPASSDGVRRPGFGFARFSLLTETTPASGSPVIPIGEYIDAGFVTLTAPMDTGTGTTQLFDDDWESSYVAAAANPVEIIIEFSSPKQSGAARARFGDSDYAWSLDAADSMADLAGETATFINIFTGSAVAGGAVAWEQWNATPVARKIYRFRVERFDPGLVEIRQLELQQARPVLTVDIGGSPAAINCLEVLPANPRIETGGSIGLTAEASLSLGPDRYDVSSDAAWASSNNSVATVAADGTVSAVSAGTASITASFAGLSAQASVVVVSIGPRDDDVSVAWIQRLPVIDYLWDSPQPDVDGWPAAGSTVTWRAMVKNAYPFHRYNVGYRWLVDGTVIDSGRTDLDPSAWTPVDLPRTWTFDREELTFEIDPDDELAELSEQNNALSVFTDSITVGFWVEQSVYDYFHDHQHELALGSNGWEDYAQRQVDRWNSMWAGAIHPVDAPEGVLDRVRIDKITIVPDGALPLQGGSYPTNYPDTSDRTVDLTWGFPASLLGTGMYNNHTDAVETNPFYYDGGLIHELGHARYLIDAYGFNVVDGAAFPHVLVTHDGELIAGSAYLPRSWAWWDHVHIAYPGIGNPYEGLMGSDYTFVDRYSAAALNRIAGHRAVKGNFNAPYNIGEFINDLPDANTIQLFDGCGVPIANATVSLYQAGPASGEWYGKQFDDTADAVFASDVNGRVDVGRNPFAPGDLSHTYGISNMVALLKVEDAGRTGFAFLEAALFNMEYWRGHVDRGHYALTVPMLGNNREIARIRPFRSGNDWRVQVIAGGDLQPDAVTIDGETADFQEGSWWGWVRASGGLSEPQPVTAAWPGDPEVHLWFQVPPPVPLPALLVEPAPSPADTLLLDWTTRAGDAYLMEWSGDLETWLPVPGDWIFGDGLPVTVETPMTGSHGFYRIDTVPLGHRSAAP